MGIRTLNGQGRNDDTERAELNAVLASKTFVRAQRLVKLLEYISEKHFRGEADQVREYTIATEVLGRPPDFDPAEDAISRVEIHRLRKKLREYYATEGAHDPITIVIPSGMYTPTFLHGNGPARVTAVDEPPASVEPPVPVTEPEMPAPDESSVVAALDAGNRSRRKWLALAAAPVVLVGVLSLWFASTHRAAELAVSVVPAPAAAPADHSIRIIAGYDRPQYVDRLGRRWLSDRYYEGGGTLGAPFRQFIARTADPVLYQSGRAGMSAYHIPLKPGNYEMKLHFAETIYGPGLETGGGENSRVTDILANGVRLLTYFDIVSDAGGPDIADIRVFKDMRPDSDGYLDLRFHPLRALPLINAIEIEPAEPHKMNPIRLVTQTNPVTDSKGQVWEADNYFMGGQNSNHWKTVTPDPELFQNERYGHFSYAIPVADGSYTVRLYFAETYFGPDNLGATGAGSRLFDVFCNGSALVRGLDIFREAGSNKALVKTFRGLRPNAQGKLDLNFIPVVNYASLFAIEVFDEAR